MLSELAEVGIFYCTLFVAVDLYACVFTTFFAPPITGAYLQSLLWGWACAEQLRIRDSVRGTEARWELSRV